ncbi:hypothetical protein R1sor_012143 [Riccia sorocarpa]|uniref:PPIase cyclophilin-type domain-containing protein n=1 Tax=Riccia sorocarpa TaxID=122646 RepID=A0ABD3I6W8_9MARC
MSIILSAAAATVPTAYGQRFKAVGNGGLPTLQNAGKSSSRWVGKLPAVRADLSASDSEESRNVAVPQEVIPSSTSSSRPWSNKIMGSALAAALTISQALAPFPESFAEFWSVPRAEAVLYSPDTKVPRSAEVALRRAIPAVNPSMKKMQEALEDIFYLLRIPQRKPYGTMESDVKKALQLVKDDKDAILAAVPDNLKERGQELYNQLTGPGGLGKMLEAIADKDADKVSIRLANSLETISELEIIQAPGLAFLVPPGYQEYPRLTGRATVQMKLEKGDGSAFTVAAGGGPQKTAELEIVLDGYSAPLTAGNFADLVLKGKYDNVKFRTGEQSLLCDDQGEGVGNPVPLEILPAGEFQPLYQTTLDVQDGEIPVLPLSVYGAVAMAHNVQAEDFSSPSQFFFYLYEKRNAGLGGLAFDEGQFSVFGYVTKGKELLSQLKTGDIIKSATLVSGQDRLVLPSSTS